MKIMIVEDHGDMRRVLRNIVLSSTAGTVEIIECESGEDAVGQYDLHHPEYVLMDIELKKMNGFEAAEEIRRKDARAKIIIVTSHDSVFYRRRAKQMKVAGFVSKEQLSDIPHILRTTGIRGTP